MTKDFNPTEWMTTKEAAELTGYNVRYLRQLIHEEKIDAIKRGGIFWIDKGSVTEYANTMKRLGPAKHDPWRTGARQKNDEAEG